MIYVPTSSCQLHIIYTNLLMMVVKFDLCSFNKVQYKGLIFKLKKNVLSGNLLSPLADFLKLKKLSWFNIETGLLQGSILGPLFLVYINNLSDGLTTNSRPFADDVSLFSVIDNINFSATNLNCDLSKINVWVNQWFNNNPPPNINNKSVK